MEHTSVCLICLIGLPASGKSTFAKEIEIHYKEKHNVEIVAFDQEISWHAGISWKKKRRNVYNLVKYLVEKHLKYLNKNTLIVLDDNMYYRSMRYEYFQLARSLGIGFCEIYVFSHLETCLKLNRQRANSVDENTIINMYKKLEVPDPTANKWEKNYLTITQTLNVNDWLNLEYMICNCLESPIRQVNRIYKEVSSRSTLHTADLALRKLVNAIMKQRKESCKEKSNIYNLALVSKRQKIMKSIRTGEIIVPPINNEMNCIDLYSEILRPYLLNM